MGVFKNKGTPKSSILIGFSIIFTIHFGGFPPIFWKHPYVSNGLKPPNYVGFGHPKAEGERGEGRGRIPKAVADGTLGPVGYWNGDMMWRIGYPFPYLREI